VRNLWLVCIPILLVNVYGLLYSIILLSATNELCMFEHQSGTSLALLTILSRGITYCYWVPFVIWIYWPMNTCTCSKKKRGSYSYGSTGESPNQGNNDDGINKSRSDDDDSDNDNAD
jgi:hypothetical protein